MHGVFSGPKFTLFGLNTKIYPVLPRIWSKYWKIRTRENSVFEHFLGREDLCMLCVLFWKVSQNLHENNSARIPFQ